MVPLKHGHAKYSSITSELNKHCCYVKFDFTNVEFVIRPVDWPNRTLIITYLNFSASQ